jgi:O-antigen/teichoic acid export membrane protein
VAAQLGGRLLNLLASLGVTLLLVRSLGDGRFGEWTTLLAITQITLSLAEPGIEQIMIRRAAANPELEPELLGGLVGLRVALAVPVTLAMVVVVALIANGAEMRSAGILLSLLVLAYAPAGVRAAFQLRVRNDYTILAQTANTLVWAVAAVIIAHEDGGLLAFAGAFVAGGVVMTLIQLALARRLTRLRIAAGVKRWRELLVPALPLGIASALILTYARVDQVIVFELAGDRPASLYGAVYRFLDQARIIPLAIITTVMPVLAALHREDPARARQLIGLSQDYLYALTLPALAFSIAAAEPTVRLLFGPEFADSAPALPVLMAALVVASSGLLAISVMVVLELQSRLMRLAALGLAVNVIANLVLVPAYGFMAAAWLTLATELLVVVLAWRTVVARFPVPVFPVHLLRILAVSVGLGAGVGALRGLGVDAVGLLAFAVSAGPLGLILARAVSPRQLAKIVSARI